MPAQFTTTKTSGCPNVSTNRSQAEAEKVCGWDMADTIGDGTFFKVGGAQVHGKKYIVSFVV